MSIQAVNYEVEDMGRYFKSSKKKYKWTFMLEDKQHMLELEFSYLSGKRRLVLDGRVLHESMMLTSSFQYPFTLEGFALNVIQQGDAFELRINNKVFSHLYTQQKTKSEFVYDEKINNTNKTDNNFYSEPPNFNTQFSNNNNFQNNSQKINLNIKFENPKDTNPIQQKTSVVQQTKTSTTFGQPGAFEEFEQFGQVSKTSNNPFGDSFQVSGFSSGQAVQQQQKKVDLLNLDDDVPQQKAVNPPQQEFLFEQQQQQQQQEKTNIPQQTNLFDAFGNGWNQQQQQQQQQIPQQQQNMFQQPTQVPQPFESFNQMGQNTQGFQNQQQQGGFQNSHAFGQDFPQAPQQQQNLNILNLYGNQPPVVGNLAYSAFPQVQQYNQPVPQSQPTPFDLFK
ncbi:unnamed protein product (macronuclear) [Paramecium tetraurelia]|uniref:Uncharacterized protein n=1 Tax=Paramecium tetraurelia TaxID=5888 RepID=A0BJH2_PARTE|nr:uncharacterized protein GSPATT00029317001 [Paramecium tetraurelia]CAK58689.1 unnamed protein product [Paramecium tetraurelia]|eukprot:XP_001426087.1 hypothetical protein (macronuclear) [Paramecium tetraurelia strain d4-2]